MENNLKTNIYIYNWTWEKLNAGEGDNRGWDGWMASLTQDMSLSKLQKLVMDREAWCASDQWITKSQTWLSDWTELITESLCCILDTLQINYTSIKITLSIDQKNFVSMCYFHQIKKELMHNKDKWFLNIPWHIKFICM